LVNLKYISQDPLFCPFLVTCDARDIFIQVGGKPVWGTHQDSHILTRLKLEDHLSLGV
jgi:hypothetical protein